MFQHVKASVDPESQVEVLKDIVLCHFSLPQILKESKEAPPEEENVLSREYSTRSCATIKVMMVIFLKSL